MVIGLAVLSPCGEKISKAMHWRSNADQLDLNLQVFRSQSVVGECHPWHSVRGGAGKTVSIAVSIKEPSASILAISTVMDRRL
jgi:hypothetical protein